TAVSAGARESDSGARNLVAAGGRRIGFLSKRFDFPPMAGAPAACLNPLPRLDAPGTLPYGSNFSWRLSCEPCDSGSGFSAIRRGALGARSGARAKTRARAHRALDADAAHGAALGRQR